MCACLPCTRAEKFKRGEATKAVIFGHAFVQPSYSYRNVIKELREDGWLVVAPTTDVFDVVGRDIGVKFDAKRMSVKLQSKLQASCIFRDRSAGRMHLASAQTLLVADWQQQLNLSLISSALYPASYLARLPSHVYFERGDVTL